MNHQYIGYGVDSVCQNCRNCRFMRVYESAKYAECCLKQDMNKGDSCPYFSNKHADIQKKRYVKKPEGSEYPY